MSTRGFVGIQSEGNTIATYVHSDAYPTWLGVRMVEFIKRTDLSTLADRVARAQQVDEGDRPTPEQLADLKERGFWEDVSSGDDWYAALRNAQGDLDRYLDAGYITGVFDPEGTIAGEDTWLEWGYIVDLDGGELVIYEINYKAPARRLTVKIGALALMDETSIGALMATIESGEEA